MKLSQQIIEAWIKTVHKGTFNVRDCWMDLCIESPEARQHLRVILLRCEEKQQIVKSTLNGHYRIIDADLNPIDWQAANTENVIPLLLPFNIHTWAKFYPKSIIIIAGEKNAGKSAFLYETIRLNMHTFDVDLYNSETSPEQMKERFEPLDIPVPAPFNVYERYDNFADVIHPEHLSIVDYLDFNSEFYMAGQAIDDIFKKLTTGSCIIGMQKPPSRDEAIGGISTVKRSNLYVALGSRTCKLVHVKNPKTKGVNPNNKQWGYSFDNDGFFTNIVGLEER